MLRALFSQFSAKHREKRGRLFQTLLRPTEGDRILDLGGGRGDHFAAICPLRKNVIIADYSANDLATAHSRYGFKTIELDGSKRLPFADQEFDIVFCSSVIEHVTGPKDRVITLLNGHEFEKMAEETQAIFASEIRRISKRYFVQTPYRYFIIESHSWLPVLIVFLPRRLQVACLRFFGRFWPKATEPDWHLLTITEMRRLFPDAQIVRERWCFLTKSIIAAKSVSDPVKQVTGKPTARADTHTDLL